MFKLYVLEFLELCLRVRKSTYAPSLKSPYDLNSTAVSDPFPSQNPHLITTADYCSSVFTSQSSFSIILSKFGLAYLDVALYISRHVDPASCHLRSFRFYSVARSTTWKRIQASPARCFVCESKFRGQNREVGCSGCGAYYPMRSQPLWSEGTINHPLFFPSSSYDAKLCPSHLLFINPPARPGNCSACLRISAGTIVECRSMVTKLPRWRSMADTKHTI